MDNHAQNENFGKEIVFPLMDSSCPSVMDRIKTLIAENPIILFMKGSSQTPRCGFSANVVNILQSMGIHYASYDILKDNELRNSLKDYANWPTYPQLYIRGKFIGGNDIVVELHQSGELQKLL